MNLFCTNLLSKVVVALLITALLIGGSGQPVAFAQAGAPGPVIFLPLISAGGTDVAAAAVEIATEAETEAAAAREQIDTIVFHRPESVASTPLGWHARATWAFFFGVRHGNVNAGTSYIVTADIFKEDTRVARIRQTVAASCKPTGRVAIQRSAAVFTGGFLTCTPRTGGTFQAIVERMIKRSEYASFIPPARISYSAYVDPWAAAQMDLHQQPSASDFGLIAKHLDVSLELVHESTEVDAFHLALHVVGTDLLRNTGWGINHGQNSFWVGHHSSNFLAQWGPVWNTLQPYVYFLPSFTAFPQSTELLFWRTDPATGIAHTESAPWNGQLGGPTDADDLKVTIGCDANGKNCVHMTLHTLLLDPTCMGG